MRKACVCGRAVQCSASTYSVPREVCDLVSSLILDKEEARRIFIVFMCRSKKGLLYTVQIQNKIRALTGPLPDISGRVSA